MFPNKWSALRLPAARTCPYRRRALSHAVTRRGLASSTNAGHDSTHHPVPANESFGKGFYLTVAGIAISLAFYKYSNSSSTDTSEKPYLTQLIEKFSFLQGDFEETNLRHTKAVEDAGHDRILFEGTGGVSYTEFRNPEMFNTGCPHNIPAGSQVNLDAVIEHYWKQNEEAERQRQDREAQGDRPRPKVSR